MSELLTPEEQVSALTKMGVPRERAERTVIGGPAGVVRPKVFEQRRGTLAAEIDRVLGVKFIRLPWSALLPDNRKAGVIKGRMINTREYRAAKKKAREVAIEQIGQEPFTGPVRFEARVWTPNESRRRDVVNFSKLVNDALKGIAYVDDSQIDDNRWVRAGTDIDAPRCEITVTLIIP